MPVRLPRDQDNIVLSLDGREIRLTNLRKIFWPELRLTKGDLLQYYADVSGALLPHIRDRAMVMKRYPHGASGDFFFMKRAPSPRPSWIAICSIHHGSKGVIDFPIVPDGGVSLCEAAARPRARRLQPARLGSDARFHLLGPPPSRRDRLDPGHLEGKRERHTDRGLHDEERPGEGREAGRSLEAAPGSA